MGTRKCIDECIIGCSIGRSACQSSSILHSKDDDWLLKKNLFDGPRFTRTPPAINRSVGILVLGFPDPGTSYLRAEVEVTVNGQNWVVSVPDRLWKESVAAAQQEPLQQELGRSI